MPRLGAALLATLVLGGCAPTSAELPEPVAASLVTADATAHHRVLVFRACQDGHCASDVYLQWLHGQPPTPMHTTRVGDLGQGVVIREARWVRRGKHTVLSLVVDRRRKGEKPRTVFLRPAAPGDYGIDPGDEADDTP